ncbi:MAG TPA: ATP-binding protein [Candidatus Obscuribacterales bacterium]
MQYFKRKFWLERIQSAWQRRPIIWLTGVRRAGKTVLAQSLPDVEFFDCELAKTRFFFEDVEAAFTTLKGKHVVLDEIHRLPEPAQVLKIAHDHFPSIRVLATGSSTLSASHHFKDTLTGRKEEIWLTPINHQDLNDFHRLDMDHRMLHGGLPQFFLCDRVPDHDFEEWMDSYWSRDIQSLFRLERRAAFLKLLELLFVQSGSIFEASRFTAPCEINRQTVRNYLSVLESTHIVHVLRPFSSRKTSEIISAPKTYAFDSGFVAYFNGWSELRSEDRGRLWEHVVLNELHGFFPARRICYWRDKRGHEIDFVLTRPGKPPDIVECKWRQAEFDSRNLLSFRKSYPEGKNFVVCSDTDRPITRTVGGLPVAFLGLEHLGKALTQSV